jgi:hypothetical protein
MNLYDQINAHYGLFVHYVAQVGDQELAVLFSEAGVDKDRNEELTFNKGTESEVSISNLNPIVADESCKKYKAVFERFFAYEVIEESCISWDDAEVYDGRLVRSFTKSRFLDHIDSHMNIGWYKEVPDMAYKHYQICGLDFIVNVVSHQAPAIKEVDNF